MKKRSGKPAGGKQRIGVRSAHLIASNRPGANAVFLVGFMGAGKSSVGRALGQQLNWTFEDLDDRIERLEGRKVAEIFRDFGEAEFRRAEHDALQHILNELRAGAVRVVALGGGAFVQDQNARLLHNAAVPTVFLDAPVEELWQRCCKQAEAAEAERPLLRSQSEFRNLYQRRRKGYSRAAIRIPTLARPVSDIAAEIAQVLGLKKIALRTGEGEVE